MTDRDIALWIVETCVAFGAAVSTAFKVAGLFVEQLERDRTAKARSQP